MRISTLADIRGKSGTTADGLWIAEVPSRVHLIRPVEGLIMSDAST